MGHAEAIIAEFLRRNPTDPHTLVCENHGYTGECPQGFEEDHRYCDACLTRLYRNALVAPYTYPCKHCGLPLDAEATLCSCRHCGLQIHRACRDAPCGDDGGAVAIDPRVAIIGTIERAEARFASAGTPGAVAAISADIELARYELAALAAEVGTDGTPAEDNARYTHGGTVCPCQGDGQ